MTTVDSLPEASQMMQFLEQKHEQDAKERQERRLKWNNDRCEDYKRYLLECIKTSIEKSHGERYILVRLNEFKTLYTHFILDAQGHDVIDEKKLAFHFVHYGNYSHVSPNWRSRVPFSQTRDPFRELQTELFDKKGWVLLDESDPQKSKVFFLTLYQGKPEHYETAPLLWHKKNKLLVDVPRFIPQITIKRRD